jgi:hypothetical protein
MLCKVRNWEANLVTPGLMISLFLVKDIMHSKVWWCPYSKMFHWASSGRGHIHLEV